MSPSDEAGLIDLSVNRPATSAYRDALATLLPRLPKDRRFGHLQDYHPPEGPLWARAAVADWLNGVAGDGDAGRVVLTDGAQHGLACVLRALAQRGDIILADSITYQGISALCRSEGLDLRGLPIDREGMRPDAFEAACATLRPRAVFLVPSLHNSGAGASDDHPALGGDLAPEFHRLLVFAARGQRPRGAEHGDLAHVGMRRKKLESITQFADGGLDDSHVTARLDIRHQLQRIFHDIGHHAIRRGHDHVFARRHLALRVAEEIQAKEHGQAKRGQAHEVTS